MGSVYLGQGSSEDPTNPGYAGTGPNDSTYLNFVGPTGMAYSIGQNVLITYTPNPTAYSFYATVLSYNSTTGNTEVNNVRDIVGAWGNDNIWVVGGAPVVLTMNIVGLDGPTGPAGPAGTLYAPNFQLISTNNILYYNSTSGMVTYAPYPNLSQYATISTAQILYNKTLSSVSLQASTIVNGTFTINGSGGSNGQVLAATGSGLTWTSPANLPFVSFTKQSDQDISTAIVVFPSGATLSSGTVLGTMSSGVYTFRAAGNYQITASFNLSVFGTATGFPNADLWGVLNGGGGPNGADNIRYLQLAVNGVKKGSVTEIVNISSANTTFYWWNNNAVRVNGTGATTTKLSFVQLASLSAS